MEHQKLLNLFNEAGNSKFVTINWNIASDQSNANYSVGSKIIYSAEVPKSILWDYNDVYILVSYGYYNT